MEVNVEARNLFYNEMCFEMPGIYSQPILESLGWLSAHTSCNEGDAYQSELELS